MAAAFRASAVAGNGQSATTTSLAITIPGTAVAGDTAALAITSSSSTVNLTTPAGWSVQFGPNRVGSSATTWLLTRTLATGDPGAAVTLTFSAAARCDAQMVVFSGTTATGMQVGGWLESSATTVSTIPTLSSVPSGAAVALLSCRRRGNTPAAAITLPSPWTTGPSASTAFGSSPELSAKGGYQITAATGSVGGGTLSTSSSTTGVNYIVAFPAYVTGTGVSLTGVSAVATAAVDPGSVTIDAPPPAEWPPTPYRSAIRNGVSITYTVDAFLGDTLIAQGMAPVGGTITDTVKPGVRWLLNLDLAPDPGLFDLLSPVGTWLRVWAHVRYTDRSVFDLSMGVFSVDSQSLSAGGGKLSLTAPDKWVRVQRAKFIGLGVSTVGMRVVDQIALMIQDAIGAGEPVVINATSQAVMGPQTWEKDRDKAIIDLATGIGAWVYFDRDGVATIDDLPTIGANANWLIDASPSGVLVTLDRERSRTTTYNVVLLSSSAAGGEAFGPILTWDTDPNSPTYAGVDPWGQPETAGPFGIVVYYHDTPLPLDVGSAQATAAAILARTVGLASQVSLTAVPNPAIQAFDVIDVLAPQERYDIARVIERHVVDTVTHNLDVTAAQHIEGRSTRTDPYTS